MQTNNATLRRLAAAFLLILPWTLSARNFDRSQERHWQSGKAKLRVFSYNVYNGFSHQSDTNRMDRFVQWVKGRDPDVLAMQELCGFSTEDLGKFAKKWGHPYCAIVKERRGYPVGITSKYPVEVKTKIVKGFCHGLLHVKIRGFDFLVTHLNPGAWRSRLNEARQIVDYAKSLKSDKILLMGDFNAQSPIDADYMENEASDFRPGYAGSSYLFSNMLLDYSVISTILSYPFFDLCYRFVPRDERMTYPTRVNMNIPKSPYALKRIGERIDFIFGTQGLVGCAEGYIMNGEDNDYLSDHYPVGIDLVYTPGSEK